MNENRFKAWLGGTGHLSEEDLLLYLDGELPARKAKRVLHHIQSCWQCRVQTEKVVRAITRFVDCRNAHAKASQPPRNWAGFGARLRMAAEEDLQREQGWRHLLDVKHLLRFATATVAAVMVLLWLYGGSTRTLSATEILHRAEAAEIRALRQTAEPVVYQKIHVKRRSSKGDISETIETWSDPNKKQRKERGGAEAWQELQSILRQNHLEGRLLSPSACNAWRERLRDKQDLVKFGRLADGSAVVVVKTFTRDVPSVGSIIEAGLVLRTRDWHPVEQSLRVQGQGEVREFGLSEVAIEITARNALDRSIFGELVHPANAAISIPRLQSSPYRNPEATSLGADETELLAWIALHRAGACLGEPIEVVRHDGVVVVRGVAETAQRRDTLVAALRSVPTLRIEIETVEGILRTASALGPYAKPEDPAPELRGGPLLAEARLKERLTTSEVIELANRLVSISNEWVTHAWAIHRLAQAWPLEKAANLNAPSRWLLDGVVRDHALILRETARQYRAVLEPHLLLPGLDVPDQSVGEASWPVEAREILERAQEARRSTYSLFAGPGQLGKSVDEVLVQLGRSLSDVEIRSHRIEAAAIRLVEANRERNSVAVQRRP